MLYTFAVSGAIISPSDWRTFIRRPSHLRVLLAEMVLKDAGGKTFRGEVSLKEAVCGWCLSNFDESQCNGGG